MQPLLNSGSWLLAHEFVPMTERAVKHNPEESARLYQRGVGAARGGQRRLAASMLSRAVQLDPKHEQAWLWLSGVLDDPNEIAFCLQSVLSINPGNERARQGLAWLEQRNLITRQPPSAVVSQEPVESVREPAPERERDGWWVGLRRHRRELSRAWQLIWIGLIVLLSCTLGLNLWLRETITQTKAENVAMSVTVAPDATPVPTAVPVLQPALAASGDARTLAYLSVFEAQRAELRVASDRYREATSKLGNSVVLHASAARELRGSVDQAYAALAELTPPPVLDKAHADYLEGLDEQRAAMDDMLEFYGSFSIQFANRAVLRLQDASQQIERAQTMFAATQRQINVNAYPPLTAR